MRAGDTVDGMVLMGGLQRSVGIRRARSAWPSPPAPSVQKRIARRFRHLTGATLLSVLSANCSPAPRSAVPPSASSPIDAGPDGATPDAAVIQLCDLTYCIDHAWISVTLPVNAQVLAQARVFLALGPHRVEVKRPRAVGSLESFSWSDPGKRPGYSIDQAVYPLTSAMSNLDLRITIPPELAANGVHYSVKIDAADGSQLFYVSRMMSARPDSGADPNCGRTCRGVVMRLYANSRSRIACGSNACDSGVVLKLHGPTVLARVHDDATVEVCRNGLCATASMRGIDAVRVTNSSYRPEFPAPLYWSYAEYDARSPDELLIHLPLDSAGLADGDRYVVTLNEPTRPLGRFEQTVRYDEFFPNGPACDVIPCRSAVVKGHL